MNIPNSVGSTSAYGKLSTANISHKQNTSINESRDSTDPSKVEQETSSNKQATPNFVIDEQAIALFKENQTLQPSLTQKNDDKHSFANQVSSNNETAVASYQSVNNLAQRESVQKIFGVDLFA